MSWQTITAAEVLQEWSAKEVAKIRDQQAAADNLPSILQRVVNSVRGCIVAGGQQVDQPGTVPDQLREEVITIARWRLLLSLPEVNESLLSESRKAAYDDAMKRMDRVATGTLRVELPSTPVQQSAPTNAVSTPRPGRTVNTNGFDRMGSS